MRVLAPGSLGPLALKNRVIKSATFEGMSPSGRPGAALIEHHRRVAQGGVAMTTLAYCAVDEPGRTFADQIRVDPAIAPDLRRLTDAIHGEGAAASIQLAHAGLFTKHGGPRLALGPSLAFNAYGVLSGIPLARPMSERDIEHVIERFGAAARIAAEAGFDAIELHLGHGYLLSQFISPATNRRRDRFGGSLARRMRLPLSVVRRVRAEAPGLALLAKINLEDGFRGGLTIHEAIEAARLLEAEGIDALVTSGGFTSKTPFHLLRGRAPLPEMIAAERSGAQRLALRMFGPSVVRSAPFEEMFFLPLAQELRRAVDVPLVLLGGIVSKHNLERAMDEGFDFVALGRALIADPDLLPRMQRGEIERSRCTACNGCVALVGSEPLRCVLDDVAEVAS